MIKEADVEIIVYILRYNAKVHCSHFNEGRKRADKLRALAVSIQAPRYRPNCDDCLCIYDELERLPPLLEKMEYKSKPVKLLVKAELSTLENDQASADQNFKLAERTGYITTSRKNDKLNGK